MNCPFCGAENSEQAAFCTSCGQPLTPQSPAEEVSLEDSHLESLPVDGSSVVPPIMEDVPPAAPVKKSHKGLVIGIVAAVVVVAVVVAGLLTNWFGLAGGPLDALKDAFLSSANVTDLSADFSASGASDVFPLRVEGSLRAACDAERYMTMLGTASVQAYGETSTLDIALLRDAVIIGTDGSPMRYTLDEAVRVPESSSSEDMEERLEDWKENNPDLFEELEEKFDTDKLSDCLKDFLARVNTNDWLKEYTDFAVTTENGEKIYTFKPKLSACLQQLLEALRPAFLSEDDYQEASDSLNQLDSSLNAFLATLRFALKNGALSGAELSLIAEGVTINLRLFDFGSTTVDADAIQQMYDNATDVDSLPLH